MLGALGTVGVRAPEVAVVESPSRNDSVCPGILLGKEIIFVGFMFIEYHDVFTTPIFIYFIFYISIWLQLNQGAYSCPMSEFTIYVRIYTLECMSATTGAIFKKY